MHILMFYVPDAISEVADKVALCVYVCVSQRVKYGVFLQYVFNFIFETGFLTEPEEHHFG